MFFGVNPGRVNPERRNLGYGNRGGRYRLPTRVRARNLCCRLRVLSSNFGSRQRVHAYCITGSIARLVAHQNGCHTR
jgi:hypothetical protein